MTAIVDLSRRTALALFAALTLAAVALLGAGTAGHHDVGGQTWNKTPQPVAGQTWNNLTPSGQTWN